MDRIQTLSWKWLPRPLFADSDSESGEDMLSRQRAMSLLKANQNPQTPRIYPFLGMQHFYFGSLQGVLASSQPLLQKGILSFNSFENGVEREHALFDLEDHFSSKSGPPGRFKFEVLLRWFPAVNLHLKVPGGRKLSFICFSVPYKRDWELPVCSYSNRFGSHSAYSIWKILSSWPSFCFQT